MVVTHYQQLDLDDNHVTTEAVKASYLGEGSKTAPGTVEENGYLGLYLPYCMSMARFMDQEDRAKRQHAYADFYSGTVI
jgi:hypothetical protein